MEKFIFHAIQLVYFLILFVARNMDNFDERIRFIVRLIGICVSFQCGISQIIVLHFISSIIIIKIIFIF